jgi:hypothetical protein
MSIPGGKERPDTYPREEAARGSENLMIRETEGKEKDKGTCLNRTEVFARRGKKKVCHETPHHL